MSTNVIREITQDLAAAIVRGDTMVPVCSVGPLLEHIEDLKTPSGLFEDWYITFWNTHHMDYEETFRRNDTGEYYHRDVFMSEKEFLAGQVLRDNNDNKTL